jgi:OOP family OmpA-OmpF porin
MITLFAKKRSEVVRGLIVLLLALSSFATLSHAQVADSGFYLGAGGGGAKYGGFNELCRDLTGALPGTSVDVNCDSDETVFGWKLFGGWRFTPYLAFEGGYADFGDAKGDTVIFGQDVNGEISADSLFAELIGSVPIGKGGLLLGKLGVANVDVELKTDIFAVPLGTSTSSFSTDSTDAVYGLGAEFGFTRSLLGRLEWERFDFEDGVDLFSASLIFRPGKK